MADLLRRNAVKASALAVFAGASGAVNAAETATIERYALTPLYPGIPLISYAVAHGGIVHVAGVTADPNNPGDVKDQTRQVLARIDALLAKAGTDKSKLLSAQVWLTDMGLFAAHNDAWNEWVDPKNPPVRACLLSPQLWRPGLLVEIMAVAAR
jgi:enamine deaminase RidA (YjgF/YER057c/UK114 family)